MQDKKYPCLHQTFVLLDKSEFLLRLNDHKGHEMLPMICISRAKTKFELMLTRRAKAYSSSGSVVELKIGVFTLS